MPVRYPKEQMHRIKYTKLTPEQITGKLAAVNGPASASPLSDVFAGKSLKIVLDDGPTLSYRFTGNNRLSLAEGDGRAVQAGYGALTLDRVALFSHLVPRTQRGYTSSSIRTRTSRRCSRCGSAAIRTTAKCSGRSTTATSSRPGERGARRRGTASPTASRARASTGSRTPASRRSSSIRR